jgi:hypothetical protein
MLRHALCHVLLKHQARIVLRCSEGCPNHSSMLCCCLTSAQTRGRRPRPGQGGKGDWDGKGSWDGLLSGRNSFFIDPYTPMFTAVSAGTTRKQLYMSKCQMALAGLTAVSALQISQLLDSQLHDGTCKATASRAASTCHIRLPGSQLGCVHQLTQRLHQSP